jgi:AcrR family transcriptional regulator
MTAAATPRRSIRPGAQRRASGPVDARVADGLARAPKADTLRPMTLSAETLPTRKPRRPQAERSADTQSRLIEAAITCLHKVGYSATTVSMVAHEAGVSRGAMTHQYPAKTDLMLAVVDYVFESDAAYYRGVVETMTPLDFMRRLPTLMWGVLSKPGAIAVTEIMLAARSDRDLANKLNAMQTAIDIRSHAWIVEQIEAAGLKDRADGESVHRLFVAAVRGLALEAVFRRDGADVEGPIAVLTEIIRNIHPALAADD